MRFLVVGNGVREGMDEGMEGREGQGGRGVI